MSAFKKYKATHKGVMYLLETYNHGEYWTGSGKCNGQTPNETLCRVNYTRIKGKTEKDVLAKLERKIEAHIDRIHSRKK